MRVPIFFDCRNKQTRVIDWSYDFALAFLRTMKALVDEYGVRDLEFEILDRTGLQDALLGECELVLQLPEEGVKNITVS